MTDKAGRQEQVDFVDSYDEPLKKWQMLDGSLKTGAINGGA